MMSLAGSAPVAGPGAGAGGHGHHQGQGHDDQVVDDDVPHHE